MQEVAGSPVLLSMLVLLFGEAEGGAAATPSVPTNRYELYILVLSKVVRVRVRVRIRVRVRVRV